MPERGLVVLREFGEQLVWAKVVLVVHGRAVPDVVAQVKPVFCQLPTGFDLLKDGIGTEPGIAPFGIMEEVDAGECIGGDVNECQANELTVVSVLELPGKRKLPVEERFGVFARGNFPERPLFSVVHILVIVVVELDVFPRESWLADSQCQICDIGECFQATSLTFGGMKR